LGGAGLDLVPRELADEVAHLALFVAQVQVHTGSNPSMSWIDADRSGVKTARTRAPTSAGPRRRWSITVSAPSRRTSAYVTGAASGSPSTARWAAVQDSTTPSGPHSVSGVSEARHRSQKIRAGTYVTPQCAHREPRKTPRSRSASKKAVFPTPGVYRNAT